MRSFSSLGCLAYRDCVCKETKPGEKRQNFVNSSSKLDQNKQTEVRNHPEVKCIPQHSSPDATFADVGEVSSSSAWASCFYAIKDAVALLVRKREPWSIKKEKDSSGFSRGDESAFLLSYSFIQHGCFSCLMSMSHHCFTAVDPPQLALPSTCTLHSSKRSRKSEWRSKALLQSPLLMHEQFKEETAKATCTHVNIYQTL